MAPQKKSYVVCCGDDCKRWIYTKTLRRLDAGAACRVCGTCWSTSESASTSPPWRQGGGGGGSGGGNSGNGKNRDKSSSGGAPKLSDGEVLKWLAERGYTGVDGLVPPVKTEPDTALGRAREAEKAFHAATKEMAKATATVSRISAEVTELQGKLVEKSREREEAAAEVEKARKEGECAFARMQEAYRLAGEVPKAAAKAAVPPPKPEPTHAPLLRPPAAADLVDGLDLGEIGIQDPAARDALTKKLLAHLTSKLDPPAPPAPVTAIVPAVPAEAAPAAPDPGASSGSGTKRGPEASAPLGSEARGSAMLDEESSDDDALQHNDKQAHTSRARLAEAEAALERQKMAADAALAAAATPLAAFNVKA